MEARTSGTVVRSIGLAAAGAIVVSNMVGQGVFLKGRVMLCEAASPSLEIGAWLVAGVLSICGALVFAELGAMMPATGGTYAYLRRAFGEPAAFAFGWMMLLIGGPTAIAALAAGAALFFNRLTNGALDARGAAVFSVALIAAIALVNCAPARANGRLATVLAGLKLGVLVLLIAAAFGLRHAAVSAAGAVAPIVGGATCVGVAAALRGGAAGFAAAILGALYAYNGWASLSFVAGEVVAPSRTLPRALIGGTVLVTALYVLANVGFLHVLGAQTIAALPPSASVGITTAQSLFGPASAVAASAILLVSVIATLHVTVLAFARVTLAMGGDGILFPALAGVTSRGVPARAVLTTCAIAAFAVLIAGFDKLSDAFIFNTWIFDLLVAVALIVLRRREPNAERPYRVAAYPLVPAIFILSALYVLIETIIAQPLASAIGLAIIATAFPIYALRRTRRGAPRQPEHPASP